MKKYRIIIAFLLCILLVGCGEEKPAGDTAPTLTGEHYKSINVSLNFGLILSNKLKSLVPYPPST